jgi:uncharacterized protein
MKQLAKLIENKTVAVAIVVLVLAIGAVATLFARRVEREDDLLAFLPKDNPEVKLFYDINKRFGGLDVALVGIQSQDPFDPGFLSRLRRVTKELKNTPGLDHVLSLTNLSDFTPDTQKGGIVNSTLVDEIPRSAEEKAALRKKVMSRDHAISSFISADERAVLIYCFLAYGTDPKTTAGRVKEVVTRGFPDEPKFWGGNPFISTYIYSTTQADIERLTPWAGLVIILIMMVAFRDVLATCLALLSTGIGIVISLGLMSALHIRFNIVLGSMPIIMLALGSAYAIHVLARYYTLSMEGDVGAAVEKTITGIGPTVLAAGLTTVASILSFVCMDIQPMRIFGLFTAIGLLVKLCLSLTFIPAVVRILGLKRRPASSVPLRRAMSRLAAFARTHRLGLGAALGALALAGAFFLQRVDNRTDTAAFFSEGSSPDRAEKFLRQSFGGSQFVQIHAKGDMNDPLVLREIQRIADRLSMVPHVSSALHVGQVVSQINEAMAGIRRIPDTLEQVQLLYTFVTGDPSVAQLVTDDRHQALVHLKVASARVDEVEAVLARMETWVAQNVPHRVVPVAVEGSPRSDEARTWLRGIVLARIEALAHAFGVPLDAARSARVRDRLRMGIGPADPAPVVAALARFLRSEECSGELPPASGGSDPAVLVARAVVALGQRDSASGSGPTADAVTTAVATALGRDRSDPLVDAVSASIDGPLGEIWSTEGSRTQALRLEKDAGLVLPSGDRAARYRAGLAAALADLKTRRVLLAARADEGTAAGAIDFPVQVTGLPVMNRGLALSVTSNQVRSLLFALGLVFVIMSLLFRSPVSGLLAMSPALLTLLVLYGAMGLFRIHLDIGTSMLGSIIVGAGVDYAIHLLASWRASEGGSMRDAAASAADRSGLAIWTNAIMIAAGFFILTLGEAKPLKAVGGLASAAMIASATATFILIPVLARRRAYRRAADTSEEPDAPAVAEAATGEGASR